MPAPRPRFYRGKEAKPTKETIDLGHFWCTNFPVPAPHPPFLSSSTSLGHALPLGQGMVHSAPVGPPFRTPPPAPAPSLRLQWLNLCFHMPQLIYDNFKQLMVCAVGVAGHGGGTAGGRRMGAAAEHVALGTQLWGRGNPPPPRVQRMPCPTNISVRTVIFWDPIN